MTLAPHSPRRWATAGALAAALLLTGTAQASPPKGAADRAAASRALDRAQALAQGRGVHTGRELTGALRELAKREPALAEGDRKQAQSLLGRPTDPGDTQQPGGPYTAPTIWSAWDDHFCYHWVTTTADAPPLADSDADQIPDYVEHMAGAFETSYAIENEQLGWTTPVADGEADNCQGGEDLTDVYIKQIGDKNLYGYASIDPGQQEQRRHAFQVMDNDYSAAEFPQYHGDPTQPIEVTAAHEYNHILQYAYDIAEDKWMFESTATWMEDKVFPQIDDYHQYLDGWAKRSPEPLTAPDDAKIYGSAIWNHWLDEHVSDVAVKDAWVSSIPMNSSAVDAYDSAIRDSGGQGFAPVFIDFAVATAEWDASNSGIHEGAAFPAMVRATSGGQAFRLPTDGSVISSKLDHTGYSLVDVAPSDAPALTLTGSLPDGTMGAFALVGRKGDTMTKAVGLLQHGGQTTATLDNPGQYSRITAVAINADPSHGNWSGNTGDWLWEKDAQQIELSVTAGDGGGETPGGGGETPGGGGETPGGGGHIPGGGTHGGGGSIPTGGGLGGLGGAVSKPTPSVTGSAASARLGKVTKSGKLPVTATVSGAGTVKAIASVDRATAKRLGLGRKPVKLGGGSAAASGAGKVTVNVKLGAKAKQRLKKSRKTVKVSVKLTFAPAGGASATKTVALKLKP
jgi:hypothetical protein